MYPRIFCLFMGITIMLAGFLVGCTSHQIEVKPVEIKPIHITIDVNVKVDRALDNFFSDLDGAQAQNKQ